MRLFKVIIVLSSLLFSATAYAGSCRFFTCDFHQCRAFCSQCGIKAVPCVHVYQRDELKHVLPLGPSKWERFANVLAAMTGREDLLQQDVEEEHPEVDDPWAQVEAMGGLRSFG